MSAAAPGRRRAVLATLTLGVLVMVAFDHWYTLLLGVALMLGAVVAGVFVVAVPDGFLDHDRDEDDGAGRPRDDGRGGDDARGDADHDGRGGAGHDRRGADHDG